jgi:aminoglycoside phosphotransferase (APT) family kinase protein
LHALQVPAGLPAADVPSMARGYLQRLARRDPVAATSLAPVLRRIESLSAALGDLEAPCVLVHGDLMAENVLGEDALLVDWEYAQAADPAWDLACLLGYYPRLQASLGDLLGCASIEAQAGRERLRLQQERFSLLNRLWGLAYGQGHAS